MQIKFQEEPSLPCLAWCTKLKTKNSSASIFHGCNVEVFKNGFFEGAWDGEFEHNDFTEAISFMGSGAHFGKNKITFSTPCHTLERIFIVKHNETMWVSNSLSFCLTMSNTELDSGFALYQGIYDSSAHGVDKYIKEIPLKDNKFLSSYLYCNVEVNDDLLITTHEKNKAPAFKSYTQYHEFLSSSLERLITNAQHSARINTYTSLATASRGYDGSAVAALAFKVGCENVFTFANGRPKNQVIGKYTANREHVDDSGEEIAKELGYNNILIRDRWNYLDTESAVHEYESCASGNLYYDPTVVHEKDIQNRLLLTGHFGDVIWGRKPSGNRMEKGGQSGASLYESRLRIGFIHAPIPYIAATSLQSIIEIANSNEMKPWQLNDYYDRPIPRRMIEECGVPREYFGFKKMAVGVVLIGTKENLLSKMSKDGKKSFITYLKEARKERMLLKQLYYDFRTLLYVTPVGLAFIARKLTLKLYFTKSRAWVAKNWMIYNRNPRTGSFLFPWGVKQTSKRYILDKKTKK
jgi:hypothetical protein